MSKDVKTVKAELNSKNKSRFVRVLVLVLVFCVTIVGALVISDYFFSGNSNEKTEPELVAVSVAGDKLMLNDGREVTLSELRDYMNELKAQGTSFVGSLINDMANPADEKLYNQVVDLFAEFDIICEKLPVSATDDEDFVSSSDEV